MFKNIPALSWNLTALSGLVLTVGISVSTIRSSKLSVEFADFKLDSTARLSKVVELSKELEQKAAALKEKEAAYKKLENQFLNLSRQNKPIQELAPALAEIKRVQEKSNLTEIESQLEKTTRAAVEEIEQLTENFQDEQNHN